MTQIHCKFYLLADRNLYPEILMKNFSNFHSILEAVRVEHKRINKTYAGT